MKKLFVYSAFYGASAIAVKAISFAVILWLGKKLDVEAYAAFGMLYALQQGVATFATAGVVDSVIGFLKDTAHNERPSLFSSAISSALPAAFLTLVATAIYYLWTSVAPGRIHLDPGYYAAAVASGLVIAYTRLLATLFRFNEDHKNSLILLNLPPLSLFLAGSLFVLFYGNGQSFFAGALLGAAAGLGAAFCVKIKVFVPLIVNRTTLKIASNSMPFVVVTLFGWLNGYGNNYIINELLPTEDVAAYTFLYTCSVSLLLVANPLNYVWVPYFHNLYGKASSADIEEKNYAFYSMLALLLGVAAGVILLAYPMVVGAVGGNLLSYLYMETELFFLLISVIVYCPCWHAKNYYYARSAGREVMRITLTSALIAIGLSVGLMLTVGSIGIYLGFFGLNLLQTGMFAAACPDRDSLELPWTATCLGCVIAASCLLLVHAEISALSSLLWFTAFSVLVIAVFNAKDLKFRRDIFREFE